MKVITMTKKTSHKTEQMELVISILCMVNNIKLSKTDISVLAYYVVHGVKESTDSLLINSGVTKLGALGNIKVKLMKLGFLKRTKELYKSYELNLSKDFSQDQSMNLFIKIDNS
jgi:hypothetical protein